MNIDSLGIAGAWELTPAVHADDRGAFLEWLRQDVLRDYLGHPLELAQANCSTSRAGVVRGVHFADIPPGQAKYVTCVSGVVLDVVVDLRLGSATYGRWRSVRLDDVERRAVYVAEGLGHAFMAITDATIVYLCSAPYAPGREHGVHPLDPRLGIEWPTTDDAGAPLTPVLSDKDAGLPGLAEAEAAGLLPTIERAEGFYASLAG